MRLFLDLDETLVYGFPSTDSPELRPVNVEPNAKVVFPGESYEIYFRPDLDLLKDIPFSILSHGVQEYVDAIARILRDAGLPIMDVFGRQYLEARDILTTENAFLIDNLLENEPVSLSKLRILPAATYLQVDAWETIIPSFGRGNPEWEQLSFPMPTTGMQLELIRAGDSRSLGKRLEDAGIGQ